MIDLKNTLEILENKYQLLNCETLRFDLEYNRYHVFFFYKPSLIQSGHDMFIFNADIEGVLISLPLYFYKNNLITSIPNQIYISHFYKLCVSPPIFFEYILEKILSRKITYTSEKLKNVKDTYQQFIQNFKKFKGYKPYFWRFRTDNMSIPMEKKLLQNRLLTKKEIEYLKANHLTTQFTHDPTKERELAINL